MAKSCFNCKHAKELPFGDAVHAFCTRYPPSIEAIRSEDRVTINVHYPPVAKVPCGEHKRRWFGRLKAPEPA